jgi:hypothetical protein
MLESLEGFSNANVEQLLTDGLPPTLLVHSNSLCVTTSL